MAKLSVNERLEVIEGRLGIDYDALTADEEARLERGRDAATNDAELNPEPVEVEEESA